MEKAERAILVDFLTPVWVKVTGEGGAECDSRREACLQSGNPVFQTQLRRLSGRGLGFWIFLGSTRLNRAVEAGSRLGHRAVGKDNPRSRTDSPAGH